VYFDYDDSTLRPDAREALRKNATFLKSNTGVAVEVQGNCDERGTEEYNLALGKRRAEAAKSYLVDLGVNSSRVATVSFGEEKPVAVGHDEASWAKNRRSDFVVRD
jgi:peptidoglycan-associated lipoprotein